MRGANGQGGWNRAAALQCVREKWPLFALAAIFSAITIAAQRSGGTIVSLDQVALSERLGNAAVSTVAYLGKAFWPTHLAVFYPYGSHALGSFAVIASASLLFALCAVAWQQRRRRPYLAVGWGWFLITLAPVIGIVQVGSQAMADRYTYLPLIGIAIVVAWAVAELGGRLRAGRILLPVAAFAVAAALAATTAVQLRHWRDSEALFRHALAVTENNHVAHSYLGAALLDRGETASAVAHFREALAIRSDLLTVTNNLAWVLATHPDAAHRDPRAAVELAERAAAQTGRRDPAVLDTLAAAYAAAGRFEEAVRTLDRALDLVRGAHAPFESELEARRALYRSRRPHRESPR
jgi:tetratricopeptide (TPR) repeat protein